MGALKSLEQGLALLRAIAQSDAVVDTRNRILNRIAEQASRLAQSGLVPKAIAAPAEIVAEIIARKPAQQPRYSPGQVDVPKHEAINAEPIESPAERGDGSGAVSVHDEPPGSAPVIADSTHAKIEPTGSSPIRRTTSKPPAPRPCESSRWEETSALSQQQDVGVADLRDAPHAQDLGRRSAGNNRKNERKISVHAAAGKKTRTHGSTKKQRDGSKKVRDKAGDLK